MKHAEEPGDKRTYRDAVFFGVAGLLHLACCFVLGCGGPDLRAVVVLLCGFSGLGLALLLPTAEKPVHVPVQIFGLAVLSRLAVTGGFLTFHPSFPQVVFPGLALCAFADLLSILLATKHLLFRRMPVQWLLIYTQNPLALVMWVLVLMKEPAAVTGFLAASLFVMAWGVSAGRLSFVLSALTLACHVTWGQAEFLANPLAVALLWLPSAVVFWLETLFFLLRCRMSRPHGGVQDLSVVVPARNEENVIGACLESLAGCPCVREILVVDGGSTDRTRQIAVSPGVRVIVHDAPPEKGGGRGGQIRRGVLESKGDVVVVVHADTRVEPDLFPRMVGVLNRNPGIVGGAAGTVFDDMSLGMKAVEFLNALRAVYFAVPFGDQIQFFRRRDVADRDLFPGIPLMEDVELSLRLPVLGRTVYLFGASKVSSRRWRNRGFRNAQLVLGCFFSYLIQRLWKTPDAMDFYRRYYGQGPGSAQGTRPLKE